MRVGATASALALGFQLGCGSGPGQGTGAPPPPDLLETGSPAPRVTDTASYLAACEAALGPWPAFDCFDGPEIPITVTNATGVHVVETSADLEGGRCDKPAISGCWTQNRGGTVYNERGTPFVFTCRTYGDDPLFDQMSVIAWDRESGAACFFNTHADGLQFDGNVVPRPGSMEDLGFFPERPFWYRFETLGIAPCRACHDTDPYVRDPWIEQIGVLPDHIPDAPVEPVAIEELAVFSAEWLPPRRLVHPDAAACMTCHPIGDRLSCLLAQEAVGRAPAYVPVTDHYRNVWPENRWMSNMDPAIQLAEFPTEADWDAEFGLAADTIVACCGEDPPEACFSPW